MVVVSPTTSFQVVRGFANLVPLECTVIRDGKETKTSAENLVVGDVVIVRNGSKVPADLRLIVSQPERDRFQKCSDLKLETSSITGEAEPIEFKTDPAPSAATVFEAYNVAFNGSFCVDGEGLGVVIRTGDRTV